MASICNGLFAHAGFRPFCATFLNFIGYALGAVRVSALSRFGIIYIMTHDSIGLGEDGPTHQPIEMLESLRSIPNLLTIRPADGNEVVGAYTIAIEKKNTPTVISLSRQASPTVDGTRADGVSLGAYVISEFGNSVKLDLVIVSTGTELALSVNVAKALALQDNVKVRIVSMPCWELFDIQSIEYKLDVFPDSIPVMSIEASSTHGWHKYAHSSFGINTFGKSAPGGDLFKYFGFSEDNLVAKARIVISYFKSIGGAQSLVKFPNLVDVDE